MARDPSVRSGADLFEVRFESIGGLGAHVAGKIVAGAAVLRMNMNGSHFSSYGSEKKGSVVRSFIRLAPADSAIRTSAPIEEPDVVVVFHAGLLAHPATLSGLRAGGTLIFAGNEGDLPEGLERAPGTAKVFRVDAQKIAFEEKSRENAVLIGALAEAVPELDRQSVLDALTATFAGKSDAVVDSNTRAFNRGADELEAVAGIGRQDGDVPTMQSHPAWGYRSAPIGGVLPTPGNTAHNDLHTSRTGWMPILERDKCIDCGMCDMVCPDLCLVWSTHVDADGNPGVKLDGIDYQYCKGCMRCVETCSTGAMIREAEEPGKADELRVPLFPGLATAAGGKHA
ncbi:MAG: 2-oxoacid:acceptor oxidoreductase family protein [Gammaproteobacteria bacterium]|nr:2-oxoacid:acceptor oxidoreductase family protein [Gammaproteobacteria bacterium]NNF49049.1 4Fe-4S dicluster domain-containing protein [Woeseiaceae bacterium]MBT8094846.1 2-oxoacid:acceptor oxidoreductase family protein [Gammaproteobacteria bacterium]MBT8104210.1 2-oxoacid:acceptor oxidoreductase family protein [Gammaproteobacteria bacterium]NNK24225.1 4Fe-4S dicluster domain-containing protein [Woeseiaceae bacterium]